MQPSRSRKTNSGFCEKCSVCQRIGKEIHPDVRILRKEEDEILKIESIRELCHEMEIAPLEGRVKICIIESCQRLNLSSSNAFLKTLEEPRENRFFWLITEQPAALLPTLLSRCVQFTFKPKEDESSEQNDKPFREGFQECLNKKHTEPIVSIVSEKADCLAFIQFLQKELRNSVRSKSELFPNLDLYVALDFFDRAVGLEGRLRSNANCALLLDNYLRETFLKNP